MAPAQFLASPSLVDCISFAAVFDAVVGHGRAAAEVCPKGIIVVYWDSSVGFRVTPEALETKQMTHIHYAFGVIEAGTFAIVPQSGPTEIPLLKRFITAVTTRSSCVKPLICIGGWVWAQHQGGMAVWRAVIASPASRAQFAAQAIAFCRTYGFAGIDLVSSCASIRLHFSWQLALS